MSAPDVVFVDPRVAARMDQDGGEDLVGYVRQDLYEKAVRAPRDREIVVQIMTNPDGRLVALSSWGRVWAFVSETKEDLPAWIVVTDELPQPELDS